jgi:hypothetical protein
MGQKFFPKQDNLFNKEIRGLMRRKRFNLVVLVALVLSNLMTYAQNPLEPTPKKPRTPDDYKPRTLKEVSARVSGTHEEEKIIVRGDILPSRVKLTYLGRARLLPQAKKDVLYRWAQVYAGAPEHYTQPYETELLFREGKTDYWVAVRKQVMAQFQKALKKRKAVDLYLIRLGWARNGNEWEPLVLMEDFKVQK